MAQKVKAIIGASLVSGITLVFLILLLSLLDVVLKKYGLGMGYVVKNTIILLLTLLTFRYVYKRNLQ